jgi:NitT/TauT family transport system substrate-binding protein
MIKSGQTWRTNMMRKNLLITLALILCITLGAGCTQTGDKGTKSITGKGAATTIRIAGLTGPTSMGLAKLLKDAQNNQAANHYQFSIAGSADEVTPKLVSGKLDIAAVPANLSAVLYNNTKGKIKLLAVNTLGVLYIVERGNQINSLKDLKGKKIYATGKGEVPEYVLNYLLKKNGIDPQKDITIEWKSEPTEVVALMGQEKGAIAMMPQPYVTVAQNTLSDLRIAVDLTKEWDALKNGSMLITGVFVVRTDFAAAHPDQVEKFLAEYKKSYAYVIAHPVAASKLIEELGITKAAVAEKALPYCNLTCLTKNDMKKAMEGYLKVLYDQNPKSVGGSLPDNGFYYGAE